MKQWAAVCLTALAIGCTRQVQLAVPSDDVAHDAGHAEPATGEPAVDPLHAELLAERRAVDAEIDDAGAGERADLERRREALDLAIEHLKKTVGEAEPSEDLEEEADDRPTRGFDQPEKELEVGDELKKQQITIKAEEDRKPAFKVDITEKSDDAWTFGKRGAARVANDGAPPQGVLRVVRQHYNRMETCVPSSDREQARQLSVRLMVDARGGFRQVRVTAGDLSRAVTSCIEDVFYGMRVPSYRGDDRVVSLPLWIRRAQ